MSKESNDFVAVKRQEWYIINALEYTIKDQKRKVAEAKEIMKNDDGSIIYRSLEGSIDYIEQSIKEHERALSELNKAVFKK